MTDTTDDALGLGGTDIPSVEARNETRTAEPASQLTDEQRRRRLQRRSAATRGLTPPRLSQPGLLGLPGPVQ